MISDDLEFVRIDRLTLDLANPRMPDGVFDNEEEALQHLVDTADVEEVVKSILHSGWMDLEPLIVLRSNLTVIEGNRRLAALKILREPALAASTGIDVPDDVPDKAKPDQVRCWLVDHKNDARDYIGFKHINGPFKWDALAKATYAADWLKDEPDIRAIARRLGDSHNTVVRLVNGYRVLKQAETLGFDRSAIVPARRFAFSHLYTALTRPNYRDYLGLEDSTDLLSEAPVDREHTSELIRLMTWLYGQGETPSVIGSQNPDLKRLAEVLPNRTAVAMLTTDPNLNRAHTIVEDKAQIFSEAIFALDLAAGRAIQLVGGYAGGDEQLEELVLGIAKTTRAIYASMTSGSHEGDA